MARHAEVKEKDIIAAGEAIVAQGKLPNPGAIRAKLGFKGGLLRIKRIWEKHNDNSLDSIEDSTVSCELSDLPAEIVEAVNEMIEKQRFQLEQIIIHSYQRCQTVFERRLSESEAKSNELHAYYRDYETQADESIQRLETELKSSIKLLEESKRQNEKLRLENSRITGSLEAVQVFQSSFKDLKKGDAQWRYSSSES